MTPMSINVSQFLFAIIKCGTRRFPNNVHRTTVAIHRTNRDGATIVTSIRLNCKLCKQKPYITDVVCVNQVIWCTLCFGATFASNLQFDCIKPDNTDLLLMNAVDKCRSSLLHNSNDKCVGDFSFSFFSLSFGCCVVVPMFRLSLQLK